MMGEVFTMTYADMFFVDTLVNCGYEYDFAKRKIWPLFDSFRYKDTVDVLRSNVKYCLFGDDSGYNNLRAAPEAIEAFKSKYEKFFIEDYRWTVKNFESLSTDAEIFKPWVKDVAPLLASVNVNKNLTTITQFKEQLLRWHKDLEELSTEMLVQIVFNEMRAIVDLFIHRDPSNVEADAVTLAFKKYMAGQCLIFYKFDHVAESSYYRNKILSFLMKNEDLTHQQIDTVRGFYNNYLELLLSRNLISGDDLMTYKQVYPLFAPFYVFYDKGNAEFGSIEEASKAILG
jgi:hypothetical protein